MELLWVIIGLSVGLAARYFSQRPSFQLPTHLLTTTIGALTGGYISCYFNFGTLTVLNVQAMPPALAGGLVMASLLKILRI